jgi:hypothetical protein
MHFHTVLFLVACVLLSCMTFASADPSIITLRNGKYRKHAEIITAGSSSTTVHTVLRGVQYATAERFKDPVPPPHHSGIIDAMESGDWCPQKGGAFPDAIGHQSENCQNLDVLSNCNPGDHCPVIVAATPGSFVQGGGRAIPWERYYALLHGDAQADLANFGRLQKFVLVQPNYRLNILNSYASDELDAEENQEGWLAWIYAHLPEFIQGLLPPLIKRSGMYGGRDYIAALEWVQAEIHKFGGDPNKVTLIGQSSGDTLFRWLRLVRGIAGRLFHRIIGQSGSPRVPGTVQTHLDVKRQQHDWIVAFSPCAGLTGTALKTCMRTAPVEDLIAAMDNEITLNDITKNFDGYPTYFPTAGPINIDQALNVYGCAGPAACDGDVDDVILASTDTIAYFAEYEKCEGDWVEGWPTYFPFDNELSAIAQFIAWFVNWLSNTGQRIYDYYTTTPWRVGTTVHEVQCRAFSDSAFARGIHLEQRNCALSPGNSKCWSAITMEDPNGILLTALGIPPDNGARFGTHTFGSLVIPLELPQFGFPGYATGPYVQSDNNKALGRVKRRVYATLWNDGDLDSLGIKTVNDAVGWPAHDSTIVFKGTGFTNEVDFNKGIYDIYDEVGANKTNVFIANEYHPKFNSLAKSLHPSRGPMPPPRIRIHAKSEDSLIERPVVVEHSEVNEHAPVTKDGGGNNAT